MRLKLLHHWHIIYYYSTFSIGLPTDASKSHGSTPLRGVKTLDDSSSSVSVAKDTSPYGKPSATEQEHKAYPRLNRMQTGDGDPNKLWQCGSCRYQNKINISICCECLHPRSYRTSDMKDIRLSMCRSLSGKNTVLV